MLKTEHAYSPPGGTEHSVQLSNNLKREENVKTGNWFAQSTNITFWKL